LPFPELTGAGAGVAAKAIAGTEARAAKAAFVNRNRIGELVMVTPLLVTLPGSTTKDTPL